MSLEFRGVSATRMPPGDTTSPSQFPRKNAPVRPHCLPHLLHIVWALPDMLTRNRDLPLLAIDLRETYS